MNAKDRQNIADLLDAIASRDCVGQINAGDQLIKDHPKVKELMSEEGSEWWEKEDFESNFS